MLGWPLPLTTDPRAPCAQPEAQALPSPKAGRPRGCPPHSLPAPWTQAGPEDSEDSSEPLPPGGGPATTLSQGSDTEVAWPLSRSLAALERRSGRGVPPQQKGLWSRGHRGFPDAQRGRVEAGGHAGPVGQPRRLHSQEEPAGIVNWLVQGRGILQVLRTKPLPQKTGLRRRQSVSCWPFSPGSTLTQAGPGFCAVAGGWRPHGPGCVSVRQSGCAFALTHCFSRVLTETCSSDTPCV